LRKGSTEHHSSHRLSPPSVQSREELPKIKKKIKKSYPKVDSRLSSVMLLSSLSNESRSPVRMPKIPPSFKLRDLPIYSKTLSCKMKKLSKRVLGGKYYNPINEVVTEEVEEQPSSRSSPRN
jgi:hypothetical protein